jgi:hypothetical protein
MSNPNAEVFYLDEAMMLLSEAVLPQPHAYYPPPGPKLCHDIRNATLKPRLYP